MSGEMSQGRKAQMASNGLGAGRADASPSPVATGTVASRRIPLGLASGEHEGGDGIGATARLRRSAPAGLLISGAVAALLLIALMAGATYVLLQSMVARQEMTAALVDLTWRQEVNVQRVAIAAARLRLDPTDQTRAALALALDRKREGFEALRRRDEIRVRHKTHQIVEGMPPSILKMFTDPPHQLDAQAERLLDSGRALLEAARLAGSGADLATEYATVDSLAAVMIASLSEAILSFNQESKREVELLEGLQRVALGVTLFTLVAIAAFIFYPLLRRIRAHSDEMFHLAMTDGLTGVMNRRAFMDRAAVEIARARRHGHPLAVVMLDIDRFKTINDQHGHAAGDRAIQHLVAQALDVLRPEDSIGRMGGEEFALLLPHTTATDALRVAERVRGRLETAPMDIEEGATLAFTVSAGVSELQDGDRAIDRALNRADSALYAAKSGGRNQVRLAA